MGKLETPDWIKQGYDSKQAYEKAKGIKSEKKGKTFKIKECPKCKSNDVGVVLTGKEGQGSGGWECKKCKWKGEDIVEKKLNEDEFMKLGNSKEFLGPENFKFSRYLDDKGEEVA